MGSIKICTVADKNKKLMQDALRAHNMSATLEAFTGSCGTKGWRVLIPFNHQHYFREFVTPFYKTLLMVETMGESIIQASERKSYGK